jgi:type II secretory pathway pseudopilin PulG
MILHRKLLKRRGLSLLEVLTALAIFMFSVVVISQMVDSASRTALRAQKLTQAALQCESVMAELSSGVLPLQTTGETPLPELGDQWTYTVVCEPQDWANVPIDGQTVAGLQVVHVTVTWSPQDGDDLQYTLSRVMLDPRVRVPAAEATTTSTSTSTGSSTGTGAP